MYPSLPGLTRQSIRRMMDGRIKSGHDDVMCREIMADKSGEQTIQYGVVPIDVIASMSGLDYVRAFFARRLPEPPIMQTVEPFDCTTSTLYRPRKISHDRPIPSEERRHAPCRAALDSSRTSLLAHGCTSAHRQMGRSTFEPQSGRSWHNSCLACHGAFSARRMPISAILVGAVVLQDQVSRSWAILDAFRQYS